jgi:hypothetical protein
MLPADAARTLSMRGGRAAAAISSQALIFNRISVGSMKTIDTPITADLRTMLPN